MAATKKCACMDDMINNYARDTLEEVLMRSVHNMPVIPAGVEPTPSYPTHYPLDPVVLCPPSEQVFYRVCGSRYSPQAVVLGLMSRFSRVLSPLCMYGWRERDEMCYRLFQRVDIPEKIIGMVDTDVCIGLLDLELLEGTHLIRKNKNKNKNGNKNGNKFSQKYGDPRCT
jgi:hypothetical protein